MANNENFRIRVATFNIGDFTTLSESAGNDIRYGSGTERTREEYLAVFKKVNADLWGLQEDSEFFFYPEKIYPFDALYKNIHQNYERVFTEIYNGKAFLSSHKIKNVAPVKYPPAYPSYAPSGIPYGHPWFLTGEIEVAGKSVAIVSLHFDWQCKEKRAVQIEAVKEFALSHKYCIIMGDFNPENRIDRQFVVDGDCITPGSKSMYKADWKRFSDAGLIHANGEGDFGPFGTIMHNGKVDHPAPWDNIIVTPSIKILNAEAIYEPWMNDHAIVVADLEII